MAPETNHEPLLSLQHVDVRYGGVTALDDVTFDVEKNEILGLIGPNGAGKTTAFNCLSGLARPSRGEVVFNGKPITHEPTYRIAERGIGRTFQHGALFPEMTARENLLVGQHMQARSPFLADALRLRASRRAERTMMRGVEDLIATFGLGPIADHKVKNLPFGLRKRIELVRALASGPKILLLDEPACGLNHEEVIELSSLIKDIRARYQISVLLVEHHMGMVLGVADRIVALNFGKKIADGAPQSVLNDPLVVTAYLGESEH
ncbi:branched-chain amino acid transport system ATP-binding protein [Nitrobacteraceae bacterium AZCC 1564]